MAKYYSRKDMQDILKKLQIDPAPGMVNTKEVARILTWRVEEEMGVIYAYSETSVRSRVHTGSLIPVGGKKQTSRYNTYKVEDVFLLPLYPRRGEGQRKPKLNGTTPQ